MKIGFVFPEELIAAALSVIVQDSYDPKLVLKGMVSRSSNIRSLCVRVEIGWGRPGSDSSERHGCEGWRCI